MVHGDVGLHVQSSHMHFHSISAAISLIFPESFLTVKTESANNDGTYITNHRLVPYYIVLHGKYFTSAVYYRYIVAITTVEIIS